ncbi:hypothetical protein LNTAR_08171 [Lentisphaera araneosa HTCC2155]|uniref:Uncharacterized protein n=1 Tax=Lentisphaera araneosa HTCC2155 TaxID=313628 RepID=A6DS08_9BACT|nr:hypothetical protein [Lentisphaera araneosa]EDM25583.1 hypothetical protein LNTAR_08171 [Lentisphaera araneosa HTCC2155]
MTEVVPVPILSNLNIQNIDQILHRDLIANSNDSRALVSYGFKQNGQTHFIGRREALENNWSLEFVEDLALQALDKHEEPEWEPVEVKYQGTTHTLLKREGDDLTASSILRKKLLIEIQQHFGTKSVGFAVPNRNTIIAAAVPEALLIYLNDCYHASDSQGYEKVSNMVYLIRNGNVLAAAPMPADVPAPQPIASKAKTTQRDVDTGTSANMKKPRRPTRSLKAGKSKLNARRAGTASKAGNASTPAPVEEAPVAPAAAPAGGRKLRTGGARKKISIKKKK